MSVLNSKVLVLNTGWLPFDVTTVHTAICMLCRDNPRARLVDIDTYTTYSFEEWVNNFQEPNLNLRNDEVIKTPHFSFRRPEVIVLSGYHGNGIGKSVSDKPKFSRRNIYLRDDRKCQYCGKTYGIKELNLDHILPKSKGGTMTWHNIVLSCVACNDKKRDRTPEQAGMSLIKKPTIPKYDDLKLSYYQRIKHKVGSQFPKTWEGFLGKVCLEV
jgi:5-methylcytosine-specific restriction endonuclease McrA